VAAVAAATAAAAFDYLFFIENQNNSFSFF